MELATNPTLSLNGRMEVRTYSFPYKEPDEVRRVKNVVCSAGLTALLSGLLWSTIADQNANMGSPFNTTYVAPLYGAIGNGNGVASTGGVSVTYGLNSLTDTTAAWTVNQWALGNVTVNGVLMSIVSNTLQTITLSQNWATLPAAGSAYFISNPTAGNAAVTTAITDTHLVSEIARTVVTQAGYTASDSNGNGAIQWLFLFPSTTTTQTITEAGVFAQVPIATLPPAPNSGSLLDHSQIFPALVQSPSQLVTLSVVLGVG